MATQACLRPRDRFWDIPVPKIDSAFDNLFVPQPSWSPSTTQQLRKLVAAPYLAPNDWTPRSEAYFVFPLAQGTPGKQCGLAATGDYQPSLRSPWLAAIEAPDGTVIPGTAESWEISDEGKTYVFHIRKNAKWSNGDPVTAHDFVYGLRRSVDPATASKYSQILAPILNAEDVIAGKQPVENLGVKALDDYTLEIRLKASTP